MDYKNCIEAAKRVETLLETECLAFGRGMHEKITSASDQGKITAMQHRCLRAVASIRNKLFHDSKFNTEDVPDDFLILCDELAASLCTKKQQQDIPSKKEPVRSTAHVSTVTTAHPPRIEPLVASGSGANNKSNVTVEQLAKVLGITPERLLDQLLAAGLEFDSPKDCLTNEDKIHLLDFLRRQHSAKQKI